MQVWVPAVYASPGLYLVKHPVALGSYGAAAILLLGMLSIWTNYNADRQRHSFRQVQKNKNDHPKNMLWSRYLVRIHLPYMYCAVCTPCVCFYSSAWLSLCVVC